MVIPAVLQKWFHYSRYQIPLLSASILVFFTKPHAKCTLPTAHVHSSAPRHFNKHFRASVGSPQPRQRAIGPTGTTLVHDQPEDQPDSARPLFPPLSKRLINHPKLKLPGSRPPPFTPFTRAISTRKKNRMPPIPPNPPGSRGRCRIEARQSPARRATCAAPTRLSSVKARRTAPP